MSSYTLSLSKLATVASNFVAELSSGLFRIQIFHKEKVPPFGPLKNGMIIKKEILPTLVRETAINGNRAVRYRTSSPAILTV